jgi:hypothetical protein
VANNLLSCAQETGAVARFQWGAIDLGAKLLRYCCGDGLKMLWNPWLTRSGRPERADMARQKTRAKSTM